MEGSENILEAIYDYQEEETPDDVDDDDVDVDMIDAQTFEEGEIVDAANNPKHKKKRNRRSKKNKPRSRASTITDVNRFVLDTSRRLKEKKSYLIWNAVGCLGVAALSDLVKEVDAIQACGGQMTADGKRPRNGGGILWNILKSREPKAYKEIMTKGKELEKQFRRPNSGQGQTTQTKKDISSEGLTQASDGSQCKSQVQEELGQSYHHARRVSALNRLRIPVAYDDLVGDEVKDESA